eukprot:4780011-Amphidinium_carterae.1
MPSALTSSSGSSLGVGSRGSASCSKPGSDGVSSALAPGLSWAAFSSPPTSGLTWRAVERQGSSWRQLAGGGQL